MKKVTNPDEINRDDYHALYYGTTTRGQSGVICEGDNGVTVIYPCSQEEGRQVLARLGRREDE